MSISKAVNCVRHKMPFTHLITIPFNSPKMKQEFLNFKDTVLNLFSNENGIDEHLFQTPEKLHLTFTILVLLNEEERQQASDLFSKCYSDIVKPVIDIAPLHFEIKGVDIMQKNPKRTDVLYAKINHDKVQTIADKIVEEFEKNGFLGQKETKVKLHITLMNSLYRQRILAKIEKSKVKRRKVKRIPFDSTKILQEFHDHLFISDWTLENIQLNDIKSKSEDGFYGKLTEMKWENEK